MSVFQRVSEVREIGVFFREFQSLENMSVFQRVSEVRK